MLCQLTSWRKPGSVDPHAWSRKNCTAAPDGVSWSTLIMPKPPSQIQPDENASYNPAQSHRLCQPLCKGLVVFRPASRDNPALSNDMSEFFDGNDA